MTEELMAYIEELKTKLKLLKLGYIFIESGDHETQQGLLKWIISGAIVSAVGTDSQLKRWTMAWRAWGDAHPTWTLVEREGYQKGIWA